MATSAAITPTGTQDTVALLGVSDSEVRFFEAGRALLRLFNARFSV
jgi:hypothetical protein